MTAARELIHIVKRPNNLLAALEISKKVLVVQ
jgi:hypothetical protein